MKGSKTEAYDRRRIEANFGRRIGFLTIVRDVGRRQRGSGRKFDVLYLCKCDCGKEIVKPACSLRHRYYSSCGCSQNRRYLSGHLAPAWRGVGEVPGDYFQRFKSSAAKRGLTFTITAQFVSDLYESQNRRCALTGWPIRFAPKRVSRGTSASLDRIDSLKGYDPDNVQWVHKDVNRLKVFLPEGRFFDLCVAVGDYVRNGPPRVVQCHAEGDLDYQI